MQFSLMFWGDHGRGPGAYQCVADAARHADEHGYAGLWTPERHYHSFGGHFPKPSVLSAALAPITRNLQLRGGSVVLPLHDPMRVAEEWSLVDNLSGGRAAIAVASGWNPDDFVGTRDPTSVFDQRWKVMWSSLDVVESLWRGESIRGVNGLGSEIEVSLFPRPTQRQLPIWVTCTRSPLTFHEAGRRGHAVLTNLLAQSPEDLRKNIQRYRRVFRPGLWSGKPKVSLMVHTLLGRSRAEVEEVCRTPFHEFLRRSGELMIPRSDRERLKGASSKVMEDVFEFAYQRFVRSASLLGSPEEAYDAVEQFREMGVDELCCLVDFGVPYRVILHGLPFLTKLAESVE